MTLYMFRTVLPSIIGTSRLYIQLSYRYCCLLASEYLAATCYLMMGGKTGICKTGICQTGICKTGICQTGIVKQAFVKQAFVKQAFVKRAFVKEILLSAC